MIDSVPSCQTCRIAIVDSVLLGAANDPLIAVRPPGFLRDSKGRHYLTFNGWSQPILTYDSAGKYIGRVGTSGHGPGEYEMAMRVIVGPGDSLHVFQWSGIPGEVFAPNGKYVRTIDTKKGTPVVINRTGSARGLSLQTESYPPKRGGVFVRRHDINGAVIDSFLVFAPETGAISKVTEGDGVYEYQHKLRPDVFGAPDGSVWTLAQTNYRLEQHDTNGVARKLFGVITSDSPVPAMTEEDVRRRAADGHPIPDHPVVRSEKTKRHLRPIRWVDVDDSGLLWVSRQIPAPAWDTIAPKRKMADAHEAPDEEVIPSEVADRLYHTIIEIIDPRVGRMLARIELPFMGERVRPGFIGRVRANDDGLLLPTVYRLQFSRQ